MILSAIVFTAERYKQFDFPYPWMSSSYNLMIPFPEITLNIGAPWEPFTKEVPLLRRKMLLSHFN